MQQETLISRGWRQAALGLFVLLAFLAPQCLEAAQRIAFVGVWDRSMALLDSACRECDLSAAFYSTSEFANIKSDDEAASFPLVFVLNLEASESPKLTARLQKAHEKNPQQRVIPLDTRSSHVDLDKAGLLVKDEAIVAYWRPNGPINLKRMMHYVRAHYLGGSDPIAPAVMIPESGYYDLASEDPFDKFETYRAFKIAQKRWKDGAPIAALIIQQSFWITHDLKVVDAQIHALENHGLNPVVVFGDREEQVKTLLRAVKPTLLVEDRHGAMWESNALLKELDVPYLRPISMLGTTVEDWVKDPRGMSVKDVGMFMSLQESWGTIEPLVVGGLKANFQGFRLHDPIPDRVEAFAARAVKWATLHVKPNQEKKLALIYYNKSLGQDDLMRGSPTGGFLDGPESMVRFLPRLKAAGFQLDHIPATAAALIQQIRERGRNIGPWAQESLEKMVDEGSPVLIPLSTYQRWFQEKLSEANRKVAIEKYGPPPGRLMVVTRNGEPQIVIPRLEFGNIILIPQPERGEKQDDKLLHSRDIPPPHNYLAFYWWLQEQYQADAIVHWGTHGSLELLPGKEAGMSKDSWSDVCAGNLPIVDLWITDNLGEASLARRRSYAALVDHTIPPTLSAGLKDSHQALHEDIHKFRALDTGVLKEEFRKRITQQVIADKLNEFAKLQPGETLSDDAIARLDTHLHLLFESQTPMRLHVLGEPPHPKEMAPYLTAILGSTFLEHLNAARTGAAPAFDNQQEKRDEATQYLQSVLDGKPLATFNLTPDLQKDLDFAKEMQKRLLNSDQEIQGMLHALSGGYIEAGPGPDPIRNPASVPGGKNLYPLNPEEIPTRAAWEVARPLVDDLLKKRKPGKIGIDLNGMETMRDFGVMEAQVLYLLGVRPIWNRNNLAIDVELIPAEELKRPRVDVFIAMGGLYKENFPSRVALLDKAAKLAAAAPEADNPVREHAKTMESHLLEKGYSSERARELSTAHIFGVKPGNTSGTNILYLVPRSGVWDKDDQITSVYMDNMSFVYTGKIWGEKIDGLYEEALQGTDTLLRVWASNMTSQLSNHHAYEYLGGLNMAVKKVTGKNPDAFIADVRDPSGARMRDFEEVLATNLESELLNKKWIEGLKKHDYAGAGHMAELVKNTFGWSVTRPESISQQTWNDIYEIYTKDRYQLGLNEWFEKVSPHAQQEIAATLLEAARKEHWHATAQQIASLSRLYAESVRKHQDSGGLVSGGNARLVDYAAGSLKGSGHPEDAALAQAMQQAFQQANTPPSTTSKVAGPKLEKTTPQQPEKENASRPQPKQSQAAEAAPKTPWWSWQVVSLLVICLLIIIGFIRKSGAV